MSEQIEERVVFPDDFLDFVSVSHNKQVNKLETCVEKGCHEKKFIAGSEGSGSIGLLTYCSDCYQSAFQKHASTIDSNGPPFPTSIHVDLTLADHEIKQAESDAIEVEVDLMSKDYGKKDDDGPPYHNPKPLFEHLAAIKSTDNYSAEFLINTSDMQSETKSLNYKLLPRNSTMVHTLLFVCSCILRPLLYWYFFKFVFKIQT